MSSLLSFDYFQSLYELYKWKLALIAGLAAAIHLFRRYFVAPARWHSKARLDGKTAIITGGNKGIGKETSLDLAKRGARVIIACRDVKAGIKIVDQIRAESGNGNVLVEYLDLASLGSIRKFAAKINERESHLNILINNAGLVTDKKTKTADGFEMTFGVNYLGHFLLTNLLLDLMKKSAPSRIINVSARLYIGGKINWDDINFERTEYASIKAYSQSKLANILFTHELSKRLKDTGVTSYALHPGVIATDIMDSLLNSYNLLFISRIILKPLSWIFFKTIREGAQTTNYCAVEECLQNESGQYYDNCKKTPLLPFANNDEDAVRLWTLSEDMIKSKA